MPAKSAKQQRFMGMELQRRRSGKAPAVPSMSDSAVGDYAHKPAKGYSKTKKKGGD